MTTGDVTIIGPKRMLLKVNDGRPHAAVAGGGWAGRLDQQADGSWHVSVRHDQHGEIAFRETSLRVARERLLLDLELSKIPLSD